MTKALNKDTFMKLWMEELQPTILDRIRDKIKPIRDNIQAVKAKCDQIESSQAFLAEKYDSMLESLQSTKKQVSELDQSLKQKEKKIDELEKVLKEQDVKLDEMHQYSRRDCIEITGIPVTSNDNPKQLTVELGELMGIANISEHHISIAHRLPSTRNVKDRLIAKFVHREMRDEFYRRRGRLAGKTSNDLPLISREYDQSTTSTRPNKIHINESLTAYRKRLFGKSNHFKRDKHFKYIWTANGKILLRESDSSPIHVFTRVEEFHEFENNYTSN
jgi:hypothetical protein